MLDKLGNGYVLLYGLPSLSALVPARRPFGQPATIERWTDELEEQLLAASNTDIAIGDTAVGRYEQRRMEDFKRAAPKFTDKQWAIMNAERDQHATNQGLGGDP